METQFPSMKDKHYYTLETKSQNFGIGENFSHALCPSG